MHESDFELAKKTIRRIPIRQQPDGATMQNSSLQHESIRRLQIGGFAIVAVLLMMGLYSMVLDRASNDLPVTEVLDADRGNNAAAANDQNEPPTEPLVDLGVTRAPIAEGALEAEAALEKLPETGQIVPDLEPDPNLKQPMDQER